MNVFAHIVSELTDTQLNLAQEPRVSNSILDTPVIMQNFCFEDPLDTDD